MEAIRYGDDPKRLEEIERVVDATVADGCRDLVESRALARETLGPLELEQLRREMDEAQGTSAAAALHRTFFRDAFGAVGGRLAKREHGQFQISNVPLVLRDRPVRREHGADRSCGPMSGWRSNPPPQKACATASTCWHPDIHCSTRWSTRRSSGFRRAARRRAPVRPVRSGRSAAGDRRLDRRDRRRHRACGEQKVQFRRASIRRNHRRRRARTPSRSRPVGLCYGSGRGSPCR